MSETPHKREERGHPVSLQDHSHGPNSEGHSRTARLVGNLESLSQELNMMNSPEEGSLNTDLTPGLHQNPLASIPGSHPQRLEFFRFTEESHNLI